MRDSASRRSFLGSRAGILVCNGLSWPWSARRRRQHSAYRGGAATMTEAAERWCSSFVSVPRGLAAELGAQGEGSGGGKKEKSDEKKKREKRSREVKRSRPWRCLQSRAGRRKERANRCGASFVSHMTARHRRASSAFRPQKAVDGQEPDSKIVAKKSAAKPPKTT